MVGIVILDYNNAEDTINSVESVVKYTPKELYKLIVVENGSNKETVDCVSQFLKSFEDTIIGDDYFPFPKKLPFITLLNSTNNDGYACGNNKALKIYEKDEQITHIMILNNDILFIEDIVSPLLYKMSSLHDCGIISPLLVKKDGISPDFCCARKDYMMSQFFFEYLFSFKDLFGIISRRANKRSLLISHPEYLNSDGFEIELPSGSCMLVNKELFRSIGYFDSNTFLYFEENILFRKISAIGKKNYLIPRHKCIHLGASTSKKSSSLFIMKCQMASTEYYLRTYRKSPFWANYVKVMSYLTIFKLKIRELI